MVGSPTDQGILIKIPLSRPDIIAIDGPAATGKSVIGRLLAERMGYRFLDTGTMYRAITWLAINQDINPRDEAALADLALRSDIQVDEKDARVFINGISLPLEDQRTEIDKKVSLVARVQGVRKAMVKQQQMLAAKGKIVVAGRDIGTVVVPNAPLKLYFQASAQERAKRRYQELRDLGHSAEFNQVLEELSARDKLDSERTHSPLRAAADAHIIDSEGLTIEQVLEKILALIRED